VQVATRIELYASMIQEYIIYNQSCYD